MTARVNTYIISVDNTWNGKTELWHTNDVDEAERFAARRVAALKSGNAVVKIAATEQVISYFQADWETGEAERHAPIVMA